MSFPIKPFNPAPGWGVRMPAPLHPPFPEPGPGIYPTSQPNQFSTGGGLHETFKVDRYQNLYDGHTTVRIPGGQKINMPWD